MKTRSDASDDAALSPEFARHIVETYAEDFNGYRRDVLGMKPADWQDRVGQDLQDFRRVAVSSAHGVGKTGLAAAAIHWFLATRPNPAIVATANTETQIRTKLWRELSKINQGARNRAWFEWRQDRFSLLGDATAQALAIPWNEGHPEAFAGTHETHVLGVFDEASDIPKTIWTTFAGAMSTSGARWLALGNPTQAQGVFHDACHGRLRWRRDGDEKRGLWRAHIVAAEDSPFVDRGWIEEMRHTFGENSDDFRVRCLGLPPRFSEDQFVPAGFIEAAMTRQVEMFPRWRLILGVDVGGSADRSVIVPRRGKVVIDRIQTLRGERTTDFARLIAEEIRWWRGEHGLEPEVVIESLGPGVGTLHTLEDMGYENVHGVHPGLPSSEPELYGNIRAEMWANMREWFEGVVECPNYPPLVDDLKNVRRKGDGMSGRLIIESKDQMRRRGLPSPDVGDALALTFAIPFDLLPEKRSEEFQRDYRGSVEGGNLSWMAF